MTTNDTLSKLRELVRIAEKKSFSVSAEMAQHVHGLAFASDTSPFRNIATNEPSSLLTVRRHVEFARRLRLIEFHDSSGFVPYAPLRLSRKALDERVEAEIWAYLERGGVSESQLKLAMRGLPVSDATSIWRRLDKRSITHEEFRKCLHVVSQISSRLHANRRKTYYLEPVL